MSYEVSVINQSGTIQCDFAGAKAYLTEQLDTYKKMVFTEDSKKEAKNTVAELRKQKKEFSDRVKEVKKEYMKPFDDFNMKANELLGLWEEPITFINGQVEEFEKKRIQEKRTKIDEIYEEFLGDMKDIVPLENIWNPKWENATFTEKMIKDEMISVRTATKEGIEVIKNQHSDVEETAIKMFLVSFDLSKSLLFIADHEKQKAEILAREQERIRREEEERIRREERERLESERRHAEELRKAEEEKQRAIEQAKAEAEKEIIESFIPVEEDAQEVIYEYHITLTEESKKKLEMFMDSIGIEYAVMPTF